MRIIILAMFCLWGVSVLATPSTLVYIPSTDIQPLGVWHLGVDSYAFTNGDAGGSFVDVGLTYGVFPRVELGFDLISGADNPLWLNGKVLVLPPDRSPVALAVGVYNWSTSDVTGQNMLYAVGSSTLAGTRFTYGYYQGDEDVLQPDDSGILLGVDRTLGRWWLGADYQGGDNVVGALNFGVGYAVNERTGIILGYDIYNADGASDSVNVQLDINF
ncbi:MAG: hypothetical protein ACYDCO_06820 [Armatimonadota bacterium]